MRASALIFTVLINNGMGYLCFSCQKEFQTPSALAMHFRKSKEHAHDGEMIAPDFLPYSFLRQLALSARLLDVKGEGGKCLGPVFSDQRREFILTDHISRVNLSQYIPLMTSQASALQDILSVASNIIAKSRRRLDTFEIGLCLSDNHVPAIALHSNFFCMIMGTNPLSSGQRSPLSFPGEAIRVQKGFLADLAEGKNSNLVKGLENYVLRVLERTLLTLPLYMRRNIVKHLLMGNVADSLELPRIRELFL